MIFLLYYQKLLVNVSVLIIIIIKRANRISQKEKIQEEQREKSKEAQYEVA